MDALTTERLRLRPFRRNDLDAFVTYRSDPTTARYQSWVPPFPRERAVADIESFVAMAGPADNEWYSLVIADPLTDTVMGDLVMQMQSGCRTAEVGYNLATEYRGKGYATEALGRLLTYLFDEVGITRAQASMHPDNFASMRVVEQCGFLYEGTSRRSYWVGDDCTDDPHYGLLRSDFDAWHNRSVRRPERVELVEVTPENFEQVWKLETHHSQRRFVSPVSRSLAQALVPEVDPGGGLSVPWYRAISADGEIVGFTMMAEPTPTNPAPYLWRLLIDRMHQHRGIGSAVIELIKSRYRTAGHRAIEVSWCEGIGSPRPFYDRHGFVPTGRVIDGETEGRFEDDEPRTAPGVAHS